jgi:hypothetical protein
MGGTVVVLGTDVGVGATVVAGGPAVVVGGAGVVVVGGGGVVVVGGGVVVVGGGVVVVVDEGGVGSAIAASRPNPRATAIAPRQPATASTAASRGARRPMHLILPALADRARAGGPGQE